MRVSVGKKQVISIFAIDSQSTSTFSFEGQVIETREWEQQPTVINEPAFFQLDQTPVGLEAFHILVANFDDLHRVVFQRF